MHFSAFLFFPMKAENKTASATPALSTIFVILWGREQRTDGSESFVSMPGQRQRSRADKTKVHKGNETTGNGWRIPPGIGMERLCDLISCGFSSRCVFCRGPSVAFPLTPCLSFCSVPDIGLPKGLFSNNFFPQMQITEASCLGQHGARLRAQLLPPAPCLLRLRG